MTHAEWLVSDDPYPMLGWAHSRMSERQLRLFACGYCRGEWQSLNSESCRKAVEVAERYADGAASERDLRKARTAAGAAANGITELAYEISGGWAETVWAEWRAARMALVAVAPGERVADSVMGCLGSWLAFSPQQRLRVCILLREILGSPIRPAVLNPAWLSWHDSTIPQMARVIYEERRFGDLPFLADALEEAGCDNADLLTHCRAKGEHVRGCWAVDLLLRREGNGTITPR
jgi:hypothetical protein